MIADITLLTALAFAVFYPLCFWISHQDPLKDNFHKFHIGLPNTVGGMVLVFVWTLDIPLSLKLMITLWKAALILVSSYSWKKEYPSPLLMSVPCAFGIFAFIRLQEFLAGPGWTVAFAGVLSALIFCAALFAMNLGHWYLNVHGLPIGHLMRATYIFWLLTGVRAFWDAYFLVTASVVFAQDTVPLAHFIASLDGFLLLAGLFFGTVFPLVSSYFVIEVLKLKNTQSATGILYVILCAVLLGDIVYKYYLVRYGVAL